jgi:hypothetical protein
MALVYDVKKKEWSGSLPLDCEKVFIQWRDTGGEWQEPPGRAHAVRDRYEAEKMLRSAVAHRKNIAHDQFRLIPVKDESNNGSVQTEKTKGRKKGETMSQSKEDVTLKSLSEGKGAPARAIKVLMDCKPISFEDLAKKIEISAGNAPKGLFSTLNKIGRESGLFHVKKFNEGTEARMVLGGQPETEEKAEPKEKKAVKAEPVKKSEKAESAPKKKAVKENGKKVTAAKPAVKKEEKNPAKKQKATVEVSD